MSKRRRENRKVWTKRRSPNPRDVRQGPLTSKQPIDLITQKTNWLSKANDQFVQGLNKNKARNQDDPKIGMATKQEKGKTRTPTTRLTISRKNDCPTLEPLGATKRRGGLRPKTSPTFLTRMTS